MKTSLIICVIISCTFIIGHAAPRYRPAPSQWLISQAERRLEAAQARLDECLEQLAAEYSSTPDPTEAAEETTTTLEPPPASDPYAYYQYLKEEIKRTNQEYEDCQQQLPETSNDSVEV